MSITGRSSTVNGRVIFNCLSTVQKDKIRTLVQMDYTCSGNSLLIKTPQINKKHPKQNKQKTKISVPK